MKNSYRKGKTWEEIFGVKKSKKMRIERKKNYVERYGIKKSIEIKRKIGKHFKGNKNPSKRVEVKEKISIANKGTKNGMWKGNEVGNNSLHDYIKRYKQKSDICENCGKKKKVELANISGKYKRDINDYKWLCRSCHTKYDLKTKQRKYVFGKLIK